MTKFEIGSLFSWADNRITKINKIVGLEKQPFSSYSLKFLIYDQIVSIESLNTL